MGFFSFDCKICSLEILNTQADITGPLSDVTVVTADGRIIQGRYDGYGDVVPSKFINPKHGLVAWMKDSDGNLLRDKDGNPVLPPGSHDLAARVSASGDALDSWFHTACWKWAGNPGFKGGSTGAEGQGFFHSADTKDEWDALVKKRKASRGLNGMSPDEMMRRLRAFPSPEENARRMNKVADLMLEHAPALRGELGPAAKKRAMELLAKAKRGE
jgi:hypothetical protein